MTTWILVGLIALLTIVIMVIRARKNVTSKPKKVQTGATATQGTPVAGNNTNVTTGNATMPKTKSKFFSKFFGTIGVILALVVTIAFIFWGIGVVEGVIKKWNAPKPHYTTFTVQTVKTVRISNVSGMNTVYVPWGADARFKKATVAFCVENNLGDKVCGDAGSDPELPKGRTGEGQTLWFTPRDDPNQSGTIEIVVTEKRQKLVYY